MYFKFILKRVYGIAAMKGALGASMWRDDTNAAEKVHRTEESSLLEQKNISYLIRTRFCRFYRFSEYKPFKAYFDADDVF